MVKISEASKSVGDFQPSIANYMPSISRRPGGHFRRPSHQLPPEPIAGNRYLCPFEVDPSSGKNVLRITIPNSKTSIGIELVPEWNEELEMMLPRALFFHMTGRGPREFEFPPDKMLLVTKAELTLRLAEAVISRPDLEMHIILREGDAWIIHSVHNKSIALLNEGKPGSCFICRSGLFPYNKISKVEILG